MKLAFSVHVDVDEAARMPPAATISPSTSATTSVPPRTRFQLREVRVWGRATPTKQPPLTVVAVHATRAGQYQVIVRAEDGRTNARTFATRHDADAWASRIDPLPLPAHDDLGLVVAQGTYAPRVAQANRPVSES